MSFWWYLLWLTVVAAERIQPTNYGAYFETTNWISANTISWYQTFILNLPPRNFNQITHKNCSANVQCTKSYKWYADIQIDYENSLNEINAFYETIFDTIPEIPDDVTFPRNKRAILGFIGKISRYLFGSLNEGDLKAIEAHINNLAAITKQSQQLFQAGMTNFTSYMFINNKRMIKNAHELNAMHKGFIALQDLVSRQDATKFLPIFSHRLKIINSLTMHLNNFKLAVSNMAHGILSSDILTTNDLRLVLNGINTGLSKNFRNYELIDNNELHYYSQSSFIISRKNHTIHLTLKIPIVHRNSKLECYKIKILPVSFMNESSSHGTILSNMSDYLCISRDKQFYMKLSNQEFDSCLPGLIKDCPFNKPLIDSSKLTCEMALFLAIKDAVKSLCTFDVINLTNYPILTPITSNKILLVNAENVRVECPHDTKIHSCLYCYVELSCMCEISSRFLYLPGMTKDCFNISRISILHPTNLVLLQSLFDQSIHEKILPSTMLAEPNLIELPDHFVKSIESNEQETDKITENLHNIIAKSRMLENKLDYISSDTNTCQCKTNVVALSALVISVLTLVMSIIFAMLFARVDLIFKKLQKRKPFEKDIKRMSLRHSMRKDGMTSQAVQSERNIPIDIEMEEI